MDSAPTPARRWVSFSNSDQQILREESRGVLWNALVVPGTLATYYMQGVGGYVLATRRPYVIDPRTPLLQPTARRAAPRASHKTLARIHDDAVGQAWEEHRDVHLEVWTPERWSGAVRRVLDFQQSFQTEAAQKIDRYEQMLKDSGMQLDVPVHGPERLIPPYWAVRGPQDPWWELSRAAIVQALEAHGPKGIMPVICLRSDRPPGTFVDLIQTLPAGVDRVFCWRGSWDEAGATSEDIAGWLQTIDAAAMKQIEVTNMYGGALSVLMTGFGLRGVNHGVGYSEARNEERLGSTGAPPMRYYVPRLRQFLPVPQAQQALDMLTGLGHDWGCTCLVCRDRDSILDLDTQQLKLHFLLSRRVEYEDSFQDRVDAVDAVRADGEELIHRFEQADDEVSRSLASRGKVLVGWARGLADQIGLWPQRPD